MRDRNLIMLGLVFLVLTIGIGVNKSLEAGNRMVGISMAPGAIEIYKLQAPAVREKAEKLIGYTGHRAKALYQFYYPQTQKYTKTVKVGIESEAKKVLAVVSEEIAGWGEKVKQAVNSMRVKLKLAREEAVEKI